VKKLHCSLPYRSQEGRRGMARGRVEESDSSCKGSTRTRVKKHKPTQTKKKTQENAGERGGRSLAGERKALTITGKGKSGKKLVA